MKRVTVIMGVYNISDRNIAKDALMSVVQQTFTDFDIIICDDGSNNDTLEVIQDILNDAPSVTYIKNPKNHGLAYSLNRCLELAQGEYIARMDIDDISYLNRFEKQVDFLDKNPSIALVSSWADLFDTKVWGIRKFVEMPKKEDFLFSTPILHGGMMIRKSALNAVGGYRAAWDTRRAEDYDLFVKLYAAGYKAYSIQSPLYQIREDKEAYRRRSYKYRIAESIIRYKGYKQLGLFPIGYLYLFKPLIVGLIPQTILKKLRKEDLESI